jgi:hypothetical protein
MIMPRLHASDNRHQRTFLFCLKYFTILDERCDPQTWQQSNSRKQNVNKDSKTDPPLKLSSCSSVLVLSLSGPPNQTSEKGKDSVKRTKHVCDFLSPWQVLNIQCYPDRHSTFVFNPTNLFSGPETFLVTLLAEFHDARVRFGEISARVTKIAVPEPVCIPWHFRTDDVLKIRLTFLG